LFPPPRNSGTLTPGQGRPPRRRVHGTKEVAEDWRFAITKVGTTLINLQQDSEGFVRMKRHFPDSSLISITFTDGSSEVFSGHQLNKAYDEALAVYRAENHLDAKGFSRAPKKTVHPANSIEFVPVHAGMAE
jgi:hypothetical protein